MKIRQVLDKKVGEVSYYKYLITLPKELVEKSNLKNKELKVNLKNHLITIEEKTNDLK